MFCKLLRKGMVGAVILSVAGGMVFTGNAKAAEVTSTGNTQNVQNTQSIQNIKETEKVLENILELGELQSDVLGEEQTEEQEPADNLDQEEEVSKTEEQDIFEDSSSDSSNSNNTDSTDNSNGQAFVEGSGEEAASSEEDSGSLKERIVTVKGSRFVTDTFNGVKALYRTGGNDGSNATYSCAAFVKKYYAEVYGVTVYNLFAGCTPISSKGNFKKVSNAKEGDIIATSSGSGNHWAIVKKVNKNGTVTLIEQNWKWQQDGKTVARVNRKVKVNECKLYRLKK